MIGGIFQIRDEPELNLLYDGKIESIGWGEKWWKLDDHVEYDLELFREGEDLLILPSVFL